MTAPLPPLVWHDAIDHLPLGVLLLDSTGCIRGWNNWMADKTEIAPQHALGQTLAELFPGFDHPRFAWAVAEVFASGSSQLLSHALNRYVIPIRLEATTRHGQEWMQQKVQIAALTAKDGTPLALVSIMDVTENAIQAQALTETARKLQESSNRDPLTGLYNRRFMEPWLEHKLKEARRHRYPIACLMIDIDHFKRINDTYGHQVGDRVLQGFVRALNGHIRESDIFARYGGEEFVLLLPHCALPMAIARAQLLVDALHRTGVDTLPAGAVTCSIGAAICEADSPCAMEDLLQQADAQLYAAKYAGRNRVSPLPSELDSSIPNVSIYAE